MAVSPHNKALLVLQKICFYANFCIFATQFICRVIRMIVKVDTDKRKIAESISALWGTTLDSGIDFLSANIEVYSFNANEPIYKENETPEYLMYLLQGKVKIYKDGICGRNQITRMINQKGFFGFRAAFAEEDYLNSASACEPSVICMIPLKAVKRMMAEDCSISMFFLKQLAILLGVSDTRTVNLTQKHIRARIAESLVTLKEQYGVEEDGSTLKIHLSREDLACLSNMTTSNAIRTLSAFAQDNIIATDGRKIKLLDEEKLRYISELG